MDVNADSVTAHNHYGYELQTTYPELVAPECYYNYSGQLHYPAPLGISRALKRMDDRRHFFAVNANGMVTEYLFHATADRSGDDQSDFLDQYSDDTAVLVTGVRITSENVHTFTHDYGGGVEFIDFYIKSPGAILRKIPVTIYELLGWGSRTHSPYDDREVMDSPNSWDSEPPYDQNEVDVTSYHLTAPGINSTSNEQYDSASLKSDISVKSGSANLAHNLDDDLYHSAHSQMIDEIHDDLQGSSPGVILDVDDIYAIDEIDMSMKNADDSSNADEEELDATLPPHGQQEGGVDIQAVTMYKSHGLAQMTILSTEP